MFSCLLLTMLSILSPHTLLQPHPFFLSSVALSPDSQVLSLLVFRSQAGALLGILGLYLWEAVREDRTL